MTTPTATDLSELHHLHQRAKAIRDRLASGPKTLATRKMVLATRLGEVEKATKALKDAKAHNKNREGHLQQIEGKIDDHKTKLNQAKKQIDYDAIKNQIAHEMNTKSKVEDEILQAFEVVEQQAQELARLEREAKTLSEEVAALEASLQASQGTDKKLLTELETAIASSEQIIPVEQRDQYVRVVKQRGADSMASVEDGGCNGCYLAVTHQMMTELINRTSLVFCKSCGRILYLTEKDLSHYRPAAS